MLQVLVSLSESAYKEMCENGVDNVDYDIRQMIKNGKVVSCVTSGCVLQSGIVRKHCDFYTEEAEPCEDVISREDVIKAVDHHTFDTDDGLCLDEDISIILEELPPVKPTQKWIPVNERLPENETRVLTTIKIPNRIERVRSGWYDSGFIHNDNGGFFHNDNGDVWKATDMEVLAWMPLPEPMKACEEE